MDIHDRGVPSGARDTRKPRKVRQRSEGHDASHRCTLGTAGPKLTMRSCGSVAQGIWNKMVTTQQTGHITRSGAGTMHHPWRNIVAYLMMTAEGNTNETAPPKREGTVFEKHTTPGMT